LPRAKIAWAQFRGALGQGLRYTHLDAISAFSEHAGTMILSAMLGRAQLGLLGICRQLLTAADTPVWSYAQAKYPAMVRSKLANGRELERWCVSAGSLVAIGLLGVTALLAYRIYDAPELVGLMAIYCVAMPARYLINIYGSALRAGGHVRLATRLGLFGFLVSVSVTSAAAAVFQLWGVACAFVVLCIGVTAAYAAHVRPLFPREEPIGH
jgi:O-antigen/teichoic acid export membrane protein